MRNKLLFDCKKVLARVDSILLQGHSAPVMDASLRTRCYTIARAN